ncbi:MAG: beta-propeller domain-containing protein [Candidatus Methanoperedens sp.]|nr:beta-propeller domain-containing protein [Candidatus Methanoperedens sp.]
MNKKMVILILAMISIAIFNGCVQQDAKPIDGGNVTIPGSTQELKKFASAYELREYLKASTGSTGAFDFLGGDRVLAGAESKVAAPGVASPQPVQAIQAPDYSKTNIQVEGVDEADFVKNDGKYIYVLAQDKLVIVDEFPASAANILSTTMMEGRPKDIFVNGDTLIVFLEDTDTVYSIQEYDYMPRPRETMKTVAMVYDISNRKKPEEIANYSLNGNYFQSRMIGDYVYLIAKDYVYYTGDLVDMPSIRKGSEKIIAPGVYYFDNPEQNYVFHTIASINIKKTDSIDAKTFMMGYSDNLYVSDKNIYITYRKNMPGIYYEEQRQEQFYAVVVPQLPQDARDKINEIRNSNLNLHEKWDKISSILEETFNRMTEKEKQTYQVNVQKALEEYEMKLAQEREKTVIQKIGIDKGSIEYKAKGEIPGSLLNQFSMDESGDYFRVATTSQFWTSNSNVQYNNVYVMDNDLEIAGKLEKIAQDERIYSTRFIGNRLYMVTFKRMDPLFVIDLSNPDKPQVLGQLKIPGFSDYLHPYDENHIIGVGKETAENEWGGVSIKGVKVSLFDVSDVNKPKQIDTYEIGKAGTDSEALRDHKAFLFDKNKNLLVIPVREITANEQYDSRYGYNVQKVWQGAYIFNITPDGFKLKGKISHFDGFEEPNYYYWGSPGAVRRSLFMDDVLYTISARKVMMNNLSDISEIKSIDLPFSKNLFESGWN